MILTLSVCASVFQTRLRASLILTITRASHHIWDVLIALNICWPELNWTECFPSTASVSLLARFLPAPIFYFSIFTTTQTMACVWQWYSSPWSNSLTSSHVLLTSCERDTIENLVLLETFPPFRFQGSWLSSCLSLRPLSPLLVSCLTTHVHHPSRNHIQDLHHLDSGGFPHLC